jgi:hypothetical protein
MREAPDEDILPPTCIFFHELIDPPAFRQVAIEVAEVKTTESDTDNLEPNIAFPVKLICVPRRVRDDKEASPVTKSFPLELRVVPITLDPELKDSRRFTYRLIEIWFPISAVPSTRTFDARRVSMPIETTPAKAAELPPLR